MKGQSEVMIFVLLFVIGLMIFIIAMFWGWGIFQQNMDMGKVAAAENFMRKLNDEISGLIKYGGSQSLDYNLDGAVELVNDRVIEIRTPVSIELPRDWIEITPSVYKRTIDSEEIFVEGFPYIREMLDGDIFKIQLIYPPPYDTGILCLEGYNISQGYSWGYIYPYSDNCGGPYSGVFFVGGGTGFIVFNTTQIPQEGDYILTVDYEIGSEDQFYENFSIGCGGQVYDFQDDVDEPEEWRWKSVTCHFNQGVNEFNFTSTGEHSVHFDSFRILETRNILEINFFTEGPRVAKPDIIKIEKNSTYIDVDAVGTDFVVTKIKITFI